MIVVVVDFVYQVRTYLGNGIVWQMKADLGIIDEIDQQRVNRAISFGELEKRAGMAEGHWRRIVRDKGQQTRLASILRVVDALGMELVLRAKR